MDPLYNVSSEPPRILRLKQRRDARLRALPHRMRGPVDAKRRQCGRATCPCARGGPKSPTRHLTVTLGGTPRTRSGRRDALDQVEALIATDPALWGIGEALTAVNLTLRRGQHPGGPAGRRPRR